MGSNRLGAGFRDLFNEVFVYSGALDVASLGDGVGASSSITVPGVSLGDHVISFSLSVSTAGITVTPNVTAADTVLVRFQNESGGTVDLASATLQLLVGTPNLAFFN